MQTPAYLLRELIAGMGEVDAAARLAAITAAAYPHMKDAARDDLIWELRTMTEPAGYIPPTAQPAPPAARDPAAAAAWFAARGVRVVTAATAATEPTP